MNDNTNESNALDKRRSNTNTIISQETFQKLTKIVAARMESANKNPRRANTEEYKAETLMLQTAVRSGTLYGLGAGVASFVFLRRFPSTLARLLDRRIKDRNSWPGASSPYGPGNQNANNPFQNTNASWYGHLSGGNEASLKWRPVRGILGFFGLAFDFGLSATMFFAVSVTMIDTSELLSTFRDVPLVEGRSVISDYFCEDFIKVYKDLAKEIRDQDHFKDQADTSNLFPVLNTFVRNCRMRSAFENELRKNRGLSMNAPLSIPSPGVPRDTFLLLDDGEKRWPEDDYLVDYEINDETTFQSE